MGSNTQDGSILTAEEASKYPPEQIRVTIIGYTIGADGQYIPGEINSAAESQLLFTYGGSDMEVSEDGSYVIHTPTTSAGKIEGKWKASDNGDGFIFTPSETSGEANTPVKVTVEEDKLFYTLDDGALSGTKSAIVYKHPE